jgi:hypothetical protein
MADQVDVVSEQGFGSNLMDSIKGIATGGLLFVFSFAVLWKNEGCVNYGKLAKHAVVVKSDAIDKSADGKFVSVTGPIGGADKIGDPEFLQPGSYIQLDRKVEMYAWTEHQHTETKNKLGGGTEKHTTYTYSKDWTTTPWPPDKFYEAKGHENPPLTVKSETFTVNKATVGAYPFNATEATLPPGEPLKLSDDVLKDKAPAAADKAAADKPAADKADADKGDGGGDKAKDDSDKKDDASGDDDQGGKHKKKGKKHHGRKPPRNKPSAADRQAAAATADKKAEAIASSKPDTFARVNENYMFRGTGSVDAPEVGDVRVSFHVLRPDTKVTLFGQLKDGEVEPYVFENGKFFRALLGSREEAIQTLNTEDNIRAWALRLVGFLMMWFGLQLFFGPINAVLDIIPFLGSAGRFLIGLVLLPVSLVMSAVTILLSIIFHNTVLLVIFLVAMAGGAYLIYQKKKKT